MSATERDDNVVSGGGIRLSKDATFIRGSGAADALDNDTTSSLARSSHKQKHPGKEDDYDKQQERPYDGFDPSVEDNIRQLARQVSHPSSSGDGQSISDSGRNPEDGDKLSLVQTLSRLSHTVPGAIPMIDPSGIDPRLDPSSDSFSSRFWVMNLSKLVASDPDYFKPVSLGVAFKDLRCYGKASDADYQANFANGVFKMAKETFQAITQTGNNNTYDILKPMDGLIKPGELTVVLGRPGAGCSSFLKTIACQTHGFHIDEGSTISYDGLSQSEMKKHYSGEIVYCAETEHHFPNLTVGDTLKFAASMRTPTNRPLGVDRDQYAQHMSEVVLATYGLYHTKNTKVGNDYIRGVSGGERKRVSIAEAALSQSKVQCWDNSTRGLDAATALGFIRALKTSASIQNTTPLIAIYQCSQDAYDLFDKTVLLYEGYEIFFGGSKEAKEYFIEMGFKCPPRQTTADYLTSITNPSEREIIPGFEGKVPRTPIEFYNYWQNSSARQQLLADINDNLSTANDTKQIFKQLHNARQAKRARPGSPYTITFPMQVKYLVKRNILRVKGDPSIALFTCFGNIIMAFITSSVFYNLQMTTGSFFYRTAVIFFATLFNAFSSLLEIFSLYEARPIVEKHKTYALYHPAADAVASIITELPNKLITGTAFNIIIYFMSNLKREAGAFFFYLLVGLSATFTMSHVFRTIGAATKSLYQAMTPASLLLLLLVIFTGFVIPTPDMLGWCRWINYLNPVAYTFEALIANEFHGRTYQCSQYIPFGPGYPTSGNSIACSSVGSRIGQDFVDGDTFIYESYKYSWSHAWRNFGINIGFIIFFFATYIILCEYNKGAMQNGEILLFQRSALKKIAKNKKSNGGDIESGKIEKIADSYEHSETSVDESIEAKLEEKQAFANNNIFHWRNLTYQVKIKSEDRVILNDVDGWVKPGQVTALMGASGAGKTTLLNTLSERLTTGVVTSGTRMVNGHSLDSSFQRSIGYVQQQDLHLETSTVREALTFSAYLRQPAHISRKEKDEYVDHIIRLLEMEKYSDAVVGVAGEGLNVEQRKRLTIGVELVAKPSLLVFLDEPTSGLDSQTAWSICKLIRKLADHGQAILCTIHQPSAILLKEFDRLLFLQKGGKTVYFGDLGEECSTLINYFEKYGAPKCPPEANPAEWMLEVIGAAPGSHALQDYFEVWKQSEEYQKIQQELDYMETELAKLPKNDSPETMKSYAAPYWQQYLIVTKRVFQQYWRTNSFLYSRIAMVVILCLVNGFSFFKANKSQQGLQNQMFSVFMLLTLFNSLVQQYMPLFVSQRDLYEVRERPSKTFSWSVFIAAQITSELPWDLICGTIAFCCWYFPIGYYQNAVPTDSVTEREALTWFLLVLFFVYTSSMGQACISFSELADNAANLANLLFSMCLIFCGILSTPDAMPGFWIFMYRFNPFTYFVSSILSTALANSDVTCANKELIQFYAPDGQTCGEYMQKFMAFAGGYLQNANSMGKCEFCAIDSTNAFLDKINVSYDHRFRDMGIFIAFIVFDWFLTIFFYWLARVPKGTRQKK